MSFLQYYIFFCWKIIYDNESNIKNGNGKTSDSKDNGIDQKMKQESK